MTEKRLSYSVIVCLLIAAGCSGSPAKKKDGSADITVDGSSGGTGGAPVPGGAGGSTGGVGGGTGGAPVTGGAGGSDAGIDAMADGSADAQPDTQPDSSIDAQTDGGEAGTCMPACTVGDKRCVTGGLQTCALVNG